MKNWFKKHKYLISSLFWGLLGIFNIFLGLALLSIDQYVMGIADLFCAMICNQLGFDEYSKINKENNNDFKR